jgi:hypothetical protein
VALDGGQVVDVDARGGVVADEEVYQQLQLCGCVRDSGGKGGERGRKREREGGRKRGRSMPQQSGQKRMAVGAGEYE